MDINLNNIEPQTPTEMVLWQYAKSLERKVISLKDDKGYYPISDLKQSVDEVSITEQQRFWHGLAMVRLSRCYEGCLLKVYTRPTPDLNGTLFEAGVYIDDERHISLTKKANAMGELFKEGIREISKIYNF